MENQPLTTKEMAEKLDVTTRQILHWTDTGVLRAITESLGGGHGSKRLYAAEHLPEAAIVAEIAQYKFPISQVVAWADVMRSLIDHGSRPLSPPPPKKIGFDELAYSPPSPEIAFNDIEITTIEDDESWYKAAIAGRIESYIIFTPHGSRRLAEYSLNWSSREGMQKIIQPAKVTPDPSKVYITKSAIVISVREVVRPHISN